MPGLISAGARPTTTSSSTPRNRRRGIDAAESRRGRVLVLPGHEEPILSDGSGVCRRVCRVPHHHRAQVPSSSITSGRGSWRTRADESTDAWACPPHRSLPVGLRIGGEIFLSPVLPFGNPGMRDSPGTPIEEALQRDTETVFVSLPLSRLQETGLPRRQWGDREGKPAGRGGSVQKIRDEVDTRRTSATLEPEGGPPEWQLGGHLQGHPLDRKSTRLNSSH